MSQAPQCWLSTSTPRMRNQPLSRAARLYPPIFDSIALHSNARSLLSIVTTSWVARGGLNEHKSEQGPCSDLQTSALQNVVLKFQLSDRHLVIRAAVPAHRHFVSKLAETSLLQQRGPLSVPILVSRLTHDTQPSAVALPAATNFLCVRAALDNSRRLFICRSQGPGFASPQN